MITDEKIAELERLAKAATPGPWIKYDAFSVANEDIGHVCGAETKEDAPYIAAANPQNIISLIERLRAAEKESIRLNGCLSRIAHPADMLDGFGTCEFAEMSMSEDYPAIAEQESNHE